MSLKKAQPDPEAGAGYGTIELEATTEPRTLRRRVVLAATVALMVVFAGTGKYFVPLGSLEALA